MFVEWKLKLQYVYTAHSIKLGQPAWLSAYRWCLGPWSASLLAHITDYCKRVSPHGRSTQSLFFLPSCVLEAVIQLFPSPPFPSEPLDHSLILFCCQTSCSSPQRGRRCDIFLSAPTVFPSQLTLLPMTGFYPLLWLEMHIMFLYPLI